MKVLHSYKIYRPDVDGGIPFVIAELCKFPHDKVDNAILVARRKGLSREYENDGVPVEAVTSLGTFFSTPLAPTFPLRLLQRGKSCDVVVHHAPFPLSDLAVAHLPASTALIVYWHADIIGFSLLSKLVTPAIMATLRRADKIVVSHELTAQSSPILASFREKWVVVPYGADVDAWSSCTAEEQARAQELRQRYPRMILGIGRLVPYKGFKHLIAALSDLDAQLVLIGEGELRSELEQMALRLGIADRVTFAGRIPTSEVKAHLYAARVFAFPSVTPAEAFGIVQLEAMAAGLPIVNTALPTAVPHVARDGQEAITVPVDDVADLTSALERILDDPSLAKRLGDAGRKRAHEEYGRERFLSRMKNVYEDAVRQRRSGR